MFFDSTHTSNYLGKIGAGNYEYMFYTIYFAHLTDRGARRRSVQRLTVANASTAFSGRRLARKSGFAAGHIKGAARSRGLDLLHTSRVFSRLPDRLFGAIVTKPASTPRVDFAEPVLPGCNGSSVG